jgi:hypothetical protein
MINKKKIIIGYILLVTFDHYQKGTNQKLQKHHKLSLVRKTISIILDLLKSTCPRKLRGFFYAHHFGVSFDQKK